MIKKITIVRTEQYLTDGENITWVGGNEYYLDEHGKRTTAPQGIPSSINLLMHQVGKMIHGKNGQKEMAIVNRIEEEK